ncbi:hypothetical protein BH20ACT5_BH20ACT5_00830 [soil metagenome]
MRLRSVTTAAIGGLAISLAGPPAWADTTFVVDTAADTVDANPGDGICADANGDCSLRAAVQEANAFAGDDTIRLGLGVTYTLTLTGADEDASATGDLDVTSNITIEGNTSTVDAAGIDRAFDVLDGELVVFGLRVTGGSPPEGQSGGGFRSTNSLVISDSEVSGNVVAGTGASGGGVFNDAGDLIVIASVIADNSATRAGGGIEANAGTTAIDNTQLTNNDTGPEPGNGGGFHLTGEGRVSVTNSAVSGNTASAEGGGLWNSATGTMFVADSTISGNTASGAAAEQGGGGLYTDGGRTVVDGTDLVDNVADGASGSGGAILNNLGTVEVFDSTITGNTAVRAGGGVEANVGSTRLMRTDLSANATGPNPGNGGGLHLTGAGSVEIIGTAVTENTASAEGGGLWNSATGVMTVATTSVMDNTASGAAADQCGGGLYNDGGSLRIARSAVKGNVADGAAGSGGGILNNLGDLEILATTIMTNSAVRAGGGIEANGGNTELFQTRLSVNSTGPSQGNGGGLHLTGEGTVSVQQSVVADNTATAEGGGLWNSATGTMTVTQTVVRRNVASGAAADQGGGGLYNDGGLLVVSRVQVTDKVADGAAGSGGGILNNLGTLRVEFTKLNRNSATRAGGAIESNVGTTTLNRVAMADNDTGPNPGNGGGLHLTGAGTVLIDFSSVVGNSATNEGGGLWNSATGTMTVNDTQIRDNTAPDGPDVYNDGGNFTINGRPVPVG